VVTTGKCGVSRPYYKAKRSSRVKVRGFVASATSCLRGKNASRISAVKQLLDVPVTQMMGQPPCCCHSAGAKRFMTSIVGGLEERGNQTHIYGWHSHELPTEETDIRTENG
jgi:hypothetical protein